MAGKKREKTAQCQLEMTAWATGNGSAQSHYRCVRGYLGSKLETILQTQTITCWRTNQSTASIELEKIHFIGDITAIQRQ